MAETYTLKVAGLTRELTICKASEHLDIAAFIMLGDAELTVACATELLKKCPEFDYLLTAEAKGIPLAHEMSRQSGKPYLCARKGAKLYMKEPVIVEDESITTVGKQKLVIDRAELDLMNGKRVLLVDDVISTGGSLHALEQLVAHCTCQIVGKASVLAEGDAGDRTDIIYLEKLPLFFH
jgi:adenine phosphoribosyltransferase